MKAKCTARRGFGCFNTFRATRPSTLFGVGGAGKSASYKAVTPLTHVIGKLHRFATNSPNEAIPAVNSTHKTAVFPIRATAAATLAVVAALAVPLDAWSAAFKAGNFVVYRVGTEASAKSVFLDEYGADGKPANGGNSIALSSVATPLTTGGAASEGLLTRSANGQCLAVPGYASAPGTTILTGTKANVVSRAVAMVDVAGTSQLIKLGTLAYDGDVIRSAISNDCTGVWSSGKATDDPNGGVWFATSSGVSALSIVDAKKKVLANTQGLAIANGQLLVSIASKNTLSSIGTGLPQSGQVTATAVSATTVNNFRGIAFVRLGTTGTAPDTLYVAANDAGSGQIQKYVLQSGTWTLKGTAALNGVHGLIALPTGDGNALLFATDSSGQLNQLFDTSGAQGALAATPTLVPGMPAGQQLLGLALTPETTPPASVPTAPSKATASFNGTAAVVQWTVAPSGAPAAFYVVEASHDNFATVDKSVVSTGNTAELSGLQSGSQKVRVRAVNSLGGSASVQSAAFVVGTAPSASLPNPTAYSGVWKDPNDPLATQGLTFTVAADSSVSASSSNQNVITDANLQFTNSGGNVTLKLLPSGVGYSDITITVTGSNGVTTTRLLKYAASDNVAGTAGTRWFTGRSDASSAVTLPGTTRVLVVDDEAPVQDAAKNVVPGGNAVFGFAPQTGGEAVDPWIFDSALNLSQASSCNAPFTGMAKCDADGEIDLESSFPVGNRLFFLGSHSNNKNGRSRPDRWRMFAVDVNPADQSTSVAGYYQWLREDLRSWDSGNLHQLGANYLGLVSSSDGGDKNPLKAPETDTLSGFSIEGSTTSPGDKQVWLGFRAPLVSAPGQPAVLSDKADNRTHALIIPVDNYAELLSPHGGDQPHAKIGAPIRLDLGQRGIREIRKNASGEYLIIAGPPNGANGTAPRNFRLFSWDGSVSTTGLALNVRALDANVAAITAPQTSCSAEGIAALPDQLLQGGSATIISDCGDADFYNDGLAAKDLTYAAWKKFRSDVVSIAPATTVALQALTPAAAGANFNALSAQAAALYAVALPAGAAAPSWEQIVAGHDAKDQTAAWFSQRVVLSAGQAAAQQIAGLAAQTGYVLYAVTVTDAGIASLVAMQEFKTGAQPPAGGAAQTIAFAELADRTLGGKPFSVSATGGASGNPVVFTSSTGSVCTVNGSLVTLLTVGTCTLSANQTGNAAYAAAPAVERSFKVALPPVSGNSLPMGAGTGATVSGGQSGTGTGTGWQFATHSAGSVTPGSLPALPAGMRFVLPNGFSFVLAGGATGATANVALQWPIAAPAGAALWKYGPTQANPAAHWYSVGGQFTADRKGASFPVKDGGDGDEDLLANGVIVDPVFLVAPVDTSVPQTTTSVPTLSDMGRVLLALALAAAAMLGIRKRSGNA